MATKAKQKTAAAAAVPSPDVSTLVSAALLNALSARGTSTAIDSLRSAVATGSVKLDESGFPIVEFNPKGGKIIVTLVLVGLMAVFATAIVRAVRRRFSARRSTLVPS